MLIMPILDQDGRVWLRSVLILTVLGLGITSLGAGNWPYWRGPEQTGSSREAAVVTSWSQEGKNLLWKFPEGGRTTPIVIKDRVFAITPVGEGVGRRERVLCLDAETGKKIWEYAFNVFHTDIVENRVGWTSLVGDPKTGRIYAHGTGGEFYCLDWDGDLIWKVSMTEELGRISGYGGRLHTPIIDEDRVIISFLNSSWGSLARPLHRYLSFDRRTGQIHWWSAPGTTPLDTTYSAPVTTVIGGMRMLIAANADGNVYGMRARTGEKVWTFRLSKRGLNSSVVVDGNYAYVCHSEENLNTTEMGSFVCIDASGTGDITETGVVWRRDGYPVGYASPAIANGRLYMVSNSANLYCLDAQTGSLHWEYKLGRVGKGSPVVTSDGIIYVGEQNGIFHILRDAGDRCVSLDREVFRGKEGSVDEIFGSPAIARGRVYFMTRYGIFGLGKGDPLAERNNIPSWQTETAPLPKESTGTLQIFPSEVTLRPGEEKSFQALHFDSIGRKIGAVNAHWSLKGVSGEISTDGKLKTSAANRFSTGEIEASWATLKAIARVRITPSLPFLEDFESMQPGSAPPGWVGAIRKTEVVEKNGQRVLKKLAPKERPSPPFMRLRVYATPVLQGSYTVESDLLGGLARGRFRPDMGLINSRYRLIMMGMRKKLRVETWSPLPRLRWDIPFSWDAEKWYRAKFRVDLEEGKARIRAKVWPKQENQPSEWQIEVVDPYPNREGSAGIYGYSTGTTSKNDGPEILYDNFKVTLHE